MTKRYFLALWILFFTATVSRAQMDERFYFPSKKMKPMDSLSYETFFPVFDGDTLSAYLLKPSAGKPKATIVYFHGAGGNVSTYTPLVKPYLKDSFQVFMVDFRGYGKSGGKPTHLNIAADGQKLFDFALGLPSVKNTQVIICGVSIGTQVAAHLASKNETKISGLILDGTIASFTEIAAAYAPEAQKDIIRQVVMSPYSAREDVATLSQVPVLFIHSKEDKEVPFAQYEMVEARCSTRHRLMLYKGDHLKAPVLETAAYLDQVNSLLKTGLR